MRTLNEVFLRGFVTEDPELRSTTTGKSVLRMTIHTMRIVYEDGESQSKADFHRIVAWQNTAEAAAATLKKGDRVFVQGHIQNDNYQDKEGKMHYGNCINAERIDFLEDKTVDEESKPSKKSK